MGNKQSSTENMSTNVKEKLLVEEEKKEAITLKECINNAIYKNHKYFYHKYFIKVSWATGSDKNIEIPIESILDIDECMIKKVMIGDTVLPSCWFLLCNRALNATALAQYITSYMEVNDIEGGNCTVSPIFYEKLWHYNSQCL